MAKVLLTSLLAAAVIVQPAAAQSTWTPMVTPWDLGTTAMAVSIGEQMIRDEMMGDAINGSGEMPAPAPPGAGRQNFSASAARSRAGAATADLTYSVSRDRQRSNLASFAARTQESNPQSAAAMRQLFSSTDVFGQIGSAVAPYGYAVDNVGDAYAFWWMTAWEGAQGSNRTFSRGEMQAVQAQAHHALAATPDLVAASDAQKQEMAEAMWIQAAMIEGMVEMAKEQPELRSRVRQSVRQGARASGLDLDAMRLTENGFVPN